MGYFETSDFYLACYLRCVGYDLSDVRRVGQRFVFVFRDRPDRRSLMMAFYNNQGAVCPLTFVGVIKDMKSMMHNL